MPPQINLAFRFDDYSAISNFDFEAKLLGLMEKYKIPCTFGVTPFVYPDEWNPAHQTEYPLTPDKIGLLKPFIKRGLVEVALHGYHHHTQFKRMDGGIPTEFFGASLKIQKEKINSGKAYLEGCLSCPVTTFIPPWNTYDINTIRAMEKLGFKCLSAGQRFGASHSSKIRYVPATCKITNIRQAVDSARQRSQPETWIIVWFHKYDFIEVDETRTVKQSNLEQPERLFAWISSQPDIFLFTIGDAAEFSIFDVKNYRLNSVMRKYQRWTPNFLVRTPERADFYPSPIETKKKYNTWFWFTTIYYALIFTAAVYSGFILEKTTAHIAQIVLPVSVTAVVLAYGYLKKHRKMYYRGLSILTAVTGVLAGVCIGFM